MTSPSTVRQNSSARSSTPNTASEMPHSVHTGRRRSGWLPSQGYAASAARACPGISISGTIRTPRSVAYSTSPRSSSAV
jgi:hypothetical protein